MSNYKIPNDAFTTELARIRSLIGEGKLQDAALSLNQAQRAAPRDARVPLMGMRLATVARNFEAATMAARRALALAPDWPVALIELALSLTRQGKNEEAMQHARKAVAQAPRDIMVIQRAAAVANIAAATDEAIQWARTGLELQPEDLQYHLILGDCLARKKEYESARPHFEEVTRAQPQNILALRGTLTCAMGVKDNAAAEAIADQLLALQPDDANAQYFHAVAHGQTPSTQPRDVVSSLFDDYASRFDMHLVRGLKYKVPERTAQILNELHPDRRFNLLDLGCGTGLLGVYLGPINGFIIGVDLSEKMIEQAARHNVYARFHNVNVLDALRDTPADHYEAITCLDVLVYVGDLTPVIPNAHRILKAGGHFIFTCEAAAEDEPDLVLRKSQRYAHKASHVERLCREAGFDDVKIEHLPALRMENDEPLPGFLVIAHKPAA
ncbi:methyltransferase [Ottowia beijingensis]|uniref:methyltransferase n=2 Tax=Ottowia beijingensis TaxID=1207057 RepID=UPI00362E8E7C